MADLKNPPRSAKLDAAASRFYKTHAPKLIADGTLNEDTLDIYLILCGLHGHVAKLNPHEDSKKALFYFACLKKIQEYSKPFGLFTDNSKAKPKKTTISDLLNMRTADAVEDDKAQDADE